MRRSLVSTARREASVGCAVNTRRTSRSRRPSAGPRHRARHGLPARCEDPGLAGGPLAQGPYAVDLLRSVGQQEVLGECARELGGLGQRDLRQALLHIAGLGGVVGGFRLLGQLAHLLDELEQLGAVLIGQGVSQQGGQPPHRRPQRSVDMGIVADDGELTRQRGDAEGIGIGHGISWGRRHRTAVADAGRPPRRGTNGAQTTASLLHGRTGTGGTGGDDTRRVQRSAVCAAGGGQSTARRSPGCAGLRIGEDRPALLHDHPRRTSSPGRNVVGELHLMGDDQHRVGLRRCPEHAQDLADQFESTPSDLVQQQHSGYGQSAGVAPAARPPKLGGRASRLSDSPTFSNALRPLEASSLTAHPWIGA